MLLVLVLQASLVLVFDASLVLVFDASLVLVFHTYLVLVVLVRHASLVVVRLRQRKAGQEAVACASSHQTATLAVSPKIHSAPEYCTLLLDNCIDSDNHCLSWGGAQKRSALHCISSLSLACCIAMYFDGLFLWSPSVVIRTKDFAVVINIFLLPFLGASSFLVVDHPLASAQPPLHRNQCMPRLEGGCRPRHPQTLQWPKCPNAMHVQYACSCIFCLSLRQVSRCKCPG